MGLYELFWEDVKIGVYKTTHPEKVKALRALSALIIFTVLFTTMIRFDLFFIFLTNWGMII